MSTDIDALVDQMIGNEGTDNAETETPEQAEAEQPEEEAAEAEETEGEEETDEQEEQSEGDEETEQEPSEVEQLKTELEAKQKRIDRQTAANRTMQKNYEDMKKAIEELKQPQNIEGPKQEDFDTLEDFYKAKSEYDAKQIAQAEIQKLQQEQEFQKAEAQRMEAVKKADASVAKLKETTPDAELVVAEAVQAVELWDQKSSQFTALQDAVFSSDNPAAVTYFFGKNPDVLDSLESATPAAIYREVAKIEIQSAKPPAKPKKQPLPEPPSKVSGRSKVSQPMSPKRSGEDILKWVNS